MAKKPKSKQKERLFEEKLVPSKAGSGRMFDVSYGDDESQAVECLGMKFENDAARRQYFLAKLREKLKDPEFRKIEGFPIGEDEDILALSDPPYYTACPNPFLDDFVKFYATTFDGDSDDYRRQPFAADVREGKNDPIYNAHSYHTKVPHKAIMRYILHYTSPGDIVCDGFCGTGMTGVAAQLCGVRSEIEALGYRVTASGGVLDESGTEFSKLGVRPAIISDLSPIASFVARNLLSPISQDEFLQAAHTILSEAKRELPDIYSVMHPKSRKHGQMIYAVWSDFLICSECGREINSWDVVVDHDNNCMHGEFKCPHCGADLQRRLLDKVLETVFDPILGTTIRQTKQKLQILHFKIGKDRFEKDADESDIKCVNDAKSLLPRWSVPTASFEHTWRHLRDGNHLRGITHSHHYYTARNLVGLSCLLTLCRKSHLPLDMLFVFTGFIEGHANRRNRYMVDRHHTEGTTCGPLSNTLFIPEVQCEVNVFNCWEKTFKKQAKSKAISVPRHCFTGVSSASEMGLPNNSVDYIFIDPPFGKNIMYSDLNLLYEAWMGVQTAVEKEAIVNDRQAKGLSDYGELMTKCFEEFHRILKPGRWLTLEFHNSLNAVWSQIQEAVARAGFVVADVRVLDKKHGTLHQDSGYTVKQDLIVSAYKPSAVLESRFEIESGSEKGMWEFVESHLGQLPVFVSSDGKAEVVTERQGYLLFDRMVGFHVQRHATVPMSAAEFHVGLAQKYPERDGMYFLPEQAAEYDRRRVKVDRVIQLDLFVSDEASAIQWLKQQIKKKPQTFQEIQPQFLKEIAGWHKHEKSIELFEILNQSFLCYEGDSEIPSQIHSYLSTNFHELRSLDKDDPTLIAKAKNRWYVPDHRKEADLEKIRHRALMKEFEEYRQAKSKLKVVRTEALRAGFKECWQNSDYQTIVDLAKRVKDEIIQEDPALLMYYDNALMRTEG
jgi:DNA methylase